MKPWRQYGVHLVIAVLATLGAASGLADDPSASGALFWVLCLFSGLYNGVLFGVGWQQQRQGALQTD